MKNIRGLWLVVAGLFLLAACQGESNERLWMKSPDWSRAQAVGGMGIPDPAPFALDDAGNIYFLFIDGELEFLQAKVVAIDKQGDHLWSHTFDDILRRPDDPQIVWNGEALYAFWISNGALLTVRLDESGNVLQEPAVISGNIQVDSYSAVSGPNGNLAVWFATDRRQSGLYTADVFMGQEPQLIDEDGVLPSIRFSKDGTMHAVWAHYPSDNPKTEFLYASYKDGSYTSGGGLIVYETNIPFTADMVGPTLGLDRDNIYIYWIKLLRTGLDAGSMESRFVTFPQTAPDQVSRPQTTFIPAEHDLSYEPFSEEAIRVGARYPLDDRPSPGLSVIQDINTNLNQENELAVVFRAAVNYYWRREASQIALVYLQDGTPTSYQLLSFTQQPSTDPTVVSDENGSLYVSWLETGDVSRYKVYFASTSDSIVNAFNPLTVSDVTDLTAATIFGLLTGVLLAPVAAVLFLVLPMLVVGLTTIIRRGEQSFRSPGTIISIILAIAIFQVAKVAALPGMIDYVPFSAWLPLPDGVKVPLQIIVPLIIMIVAVWTAWNFTYRRKAESPLYFMILYVAIDTLFTMSIYGVLFYGAF
jgi:hypothetical protein